MWSTFTSIFYFSSLLAVAIARLRRRPVIITQHMGALGLGNRSLTRLYEVGARLLGRATFNAAAREVFISANVRLFSIARRRRPRA